MKNRYLEITYRKGRALAAYLYLNKKGDAKSFRSQKLSDGLVADFDETGRLIGLEIISPESVTIAEINSALEQMKEMPVPENELAPLMAA